MMANLKLLSVTYGILRFPADSQSKQFTYTYLRPSRSTRDTLFLTEEDIESTVVQLLGKYLGQG